MSLRVRKATLAVIAVGLTCAAACSNEPEGPPNIGFDEIESRLGHQTAQPKTGLGATLIRSGLQAATGTTFKGTTAAATYRFRGNLVLVRQGRPADGWTLRGSVKREDAIFETRPDGGEVALLPPVPASEGSTNASAYILFSGWLVDVQIAPAPKSSIPMQDLRDLVAGLEL